MLMRYEEEQATRIVRTGVWQGILIAGAMLVLGLTVFVWVWSWMMPGALYGEVRRYPGEEEADRRCAGAPE